MQLKPIDLLGKWNVPVAGLGAKGWAEFAASGVPDLDFVFTVCDKAASEACPVWPGQPTAAHWGMPDPAAATGRAAERRPAFVIAFRMLGQRIGMVVNLPLVSVDGISQQQRLDDIGTD